MTDEVAIIGAGLAGLTLALALHQQGIKATVYEARPAPLNIGGAVMLSPNALRVLNALDVYDDVKANGYNFDVLKLLEVSGKLVETYEFGSAEKYGYQGNRIYRHKLIDIILSRIKSQGIPVVYGRKYSYIVEETEDHVIWKSADGTESTASCLVGADGIHSSVRKYLCPDLAPKFSGSAGITTAVPADQVTYPGRTIDRPLTILSKEKGAFVVAPQMVDGSEIFLGKQKRMEKPSREEWDQFTADQEALASFSEKMPRHGEKLPSLRPRISLTQESMSGPFM